jgi:hypothetical protein
VENNNMGKAWKNCETNSVKKMWKRILWEKCGKYVENINMGKLWKVCEKNTMRKVWKICGKQ